jgi:hypothetical protein
MLTPGLTVLEWVPETIRTTAYRDATAGVPVALVAELPLARDGAYPSTGPRM